MGDFLSFMGSNVPVLWVVHVQFLTLLRPVRICIGRLQSVAPSNNWCTAFKEASTLSTKHKKNCSYLIFLCSSTTGHARRPAHRERTRSHLLVLVSLSPSSASRRRASTRRDCCYLKIKTTTKCGVEKRKTTNSTVTKEVFSTS